MYYMGDLGAGPTVEPAGEGVLDFALLQSGTGMSSAQVRLFIGTSPDMIGSHSSSSSSSSSSSTRRESPVAPTSGPAITSGTSGRSNTPAITPTTPNVPVLSSTTAARTVPVSWQLASCMLLGIPVEGELFGASLFLRGPEYVHRQHIKDRVYCVLCTVYGVRCTVYCDGISFAF